MRAVNAAGARRAKLKLDSVDAQQVEREHRTGDVDDRVDLAYLVKDHLVRAGRMHRRFRLCQPAIDFSAAAVTVLENPAASTIASTSRSLRCVKAS